MKGSTLCFGLAGLLFLQSSYGQTRPNILIILADDAGNADFGFQGCKDLQTPNIDALAKDGVIFKDAHVSSTVSAPSSSSLDIFPTCLDAAGKIRHDGKPLDGVSLIPYLTGASKGNPHQQLFWRKDKDASSRLGDYKLIWVNQLGYRMYNLKGNLQETDDLSLKQPEKFKEMKNSLQKWESHLMKPLWTEGAVWDTITLMIHDDLYHNREVRVKEPQQLKRFIK